LQRGPNEEDLPRREVRRFELEENVIGSFDYLRSKIVSLYPDLTDSTPFRLLWTDEDGDNVCFSSDEELTQAVSFFKRQEVQLAKILIKPLRAAGGNFSGNNASPNLAADGGGNNTGGANAEATGAKAGACCSGIGALPGGINLPTMPVIGEQNWNQFNKQLSNRMEKVKNKCNKNLNHFQILEHVQQHAAQMAQNMAMGAIGALGGQSPNGAGPTNGATPMDTQHQQHHNNTHQT
jgi:hypothetical protein